MTTNKAYFEIYAVTIAGWVAYLALTAASWLPFSAIAFAGESLLALVWALVFAGLSFATLAHRSLLRAVLLSLVYLATLMPATYCIGLILACTTSHGGCK